MAIVKKVLKWTGRVLLALAVLVALFYVVENTRGKRAWEQHKRECAARGENIGDWLSLIPPPIPDEDNVAMAPIFQDLLATPARRWIRLPRPQRIAPDTNIVYGAVWQTGVNYGLDPWRVALSNDNLLAALAVYDDDLREVEEALKRPLFRHAGWDNVNLTATTPPAPYDYPSPVADIWTLFHIYVVRAMARYEAGQYDGMLEDIQTGFRIARLDKDDPQLVSVYLGIIRGMFNTLWPGLYGRVWDAQQLAALQAMLEEVNVAEHVVLTTRFKNATNIATLSSRFAATFAVDYMTPDGLHGKYDSKKPIWIYLMPRGWFYQNAVHLAKFCEQFERMIHTDDRWFDISQIPHFEETKIRPHVFHPYFFIARAFSPPPFMIKHLAFSQATYHQATIACAIERYRLEHGRIPERLDDLVPTYLTKIPCDPCDGQPMRYKLEGDGNAVIYSIGINGVDDGGHFGVKKVNGVDVVDINSGDWIWRMITN